ncbi:uncharacterized protein LOC132393965 isoform X2 [Hypanus sabinus]|uniref:uncharacterized protein LOC132393965 isoform X2 n=1 Tax=Hypanus sabinus TaxID=79690 RepID=UPI0028C3FABE|nr:uncharacterized protein LOC132393965 isoform X2 [Hypanus sabinus]
MENRCNVQCYGRGEIHEKIVKELDISCCEEPGVPCVLFVYRVSHGIQDIQNALQWVTGERRVRKEDICAVILLQKSRAVGEEKITTDPGLFHKGTKVFCVSWMDSSSWWNRSKTYQCPTVIQTVKQSLIDRTRSRGGICSGWSEDPQDSETLSVPNGQSDSRISSSWSPETKDSSLEKLICNVQCYGRGEVHEKIVEELDIARHEGPGVPCVLFVYRVSNEIQDLQNALHWVTGDGRVWKEDICAVILLQNSRDVGEGQIRTSPGLFHEGTAVHRVLWRESSNILKRRSADCQCPNTIQAIRRILSDRTRSREHPSPGQSKDPPGNETLVLSEQSASLISSGCSQRKSSWNSERLQCNVQCYGRGDVHAEIVKELNINQCEEPRIPCVLFVYNVSREIEDFRNALQWVTGDGRVWKEDICAVILLQNSRDVGEEQISTYPGLFHGETAVHRVLWSETSNFHKRRKADCQCPNTIRAIRRSLRSREHRSPGSSEDPQGSETPSLCSAPTSILSEQPDHLTSSICTQEKNENCSEKLQCNVQCYGRGDVHDEIVKELNINQCEEPRIPCVLFVYKVSHETEDFRNALQWVTGDGRVRKEDICAVILLQKSRDVGEGQIRTFPGLFHEGTAVHRVLWRETSNILKRWKTDCQCPNTIRAIRRSLSDRTRSREHPSPVGRGDSPPGNKTPVMNEELDRSISSGCSQRKRSRNSEKCNASAGLDGHGARVAGDCWKRSGCHPGSSEDPQGSETPSSYSAPTSMCSDQPDHLASSTFLQKKSEKSSEKLLCNVLCYGRGDVHEKIVKELNICQCEGPGVPCVLFLYKVSHENQDLRAALRWVTGDGTVRKEDICSVILLQKSGDFRVNKMTTDPGLFHEGTNVFQIFWTEASDTWTSTDEGHAVIQTIRQSLVNKTKSRGGSCPGSPAGGGR